jgi:8-oxo-dGTP pyrophosphatase MutT (NUDIX family)
MTSPELITELITYGQKFPQESATVDRFIGFLTREPQAFLRETHGHVTASIWILDPARSEVLLTHHKKFNQWIQLGGHADGEENVRRVALKEGFEESGISEITLLDENIFDIDIHDIESRCAVHYDVRYIAVSNKRDYVVSDESHDLRWVPLSSVALINSASKSLARMVEKTASFIHLPSPGFTYEETAS